MNLVEFKKIIGLRASPRLFAAYDIYVLMQCSPCFTRKQAIDACRQNTRCVDRALKSLIDSNLCKILKAPQRYAIKTPEQL